MISLWKDVFAYDCRRDGQIEHVTEQRHRLFPWRGRRVVIRQPDWDALSVDEIKSKSESFPDP